MEIISYLKHVGYGGLFAAHYF